MSKLSKAFQLRYMIYQTKLADILAIEAIVPTLKGNAVIPHISMTLYRLVQFTIAVIAIHLELVGFHRSRLCPLYPVSQARERSYWAIGVKRSHQNQDKHIIFLLQIKKNAKAGVYRLRPNCSKGKPLGFTPKGIFDNYRRHTYLLLFRAFIRRVRNAIVRNCFIIAHLPVRENKKSGSGSAD